MSPSLQILKHNKEVEVGYLFLNGQFQGDKENGKKKFVDRATALALGRLCRPVVIR